MRLHDFLEYRARSTGDEVLVCAGERRLTCGEVEAQANRLAHALLAAGLRAGDRIAALAKNCPELMLLYYAASKVGVVLVPLNYRLSPAEWHYILDDAGAKLLVARRELATAVDSIQGELDLLEHRVAVDASLDGWVDWRDFLGGFDSRPPDVDVAPDCALYQMYTSGTTGRPKGAVVSHTAVWANITQELPLFGTRAGDRVLLATPLYHAAGAILTFVAVALGGSVVIHEEFDPETVVDALSNDDIASTLLVPAMIQMCLASPTIEQRRFDSLRTIVYGASPIAERVLRDAMRVFGCQFSQGYGLTETTALATTLLPRDHSLALSGRPELLLSCGRPATGTEIVIKDDEGSPLPIDAVGEICIRGPQLMSGYWNLPEETKKALRDGWLHTGDAGSFDADGYLYIKDRLKDMIVSGGENVYPREVEEVLFRHPAIADAAVIGIPNERWGEAVHAVVVLEDGAEVSSEEIVDHCRKELAGYKRPRSIDFVDALPRNPSGKILKRELREPYWADRERRV